MKKTSNTLTILGTGTFFVNKNRTASSYLLEIKNKKILIDCGPGTLMRLSELGIKPENIDYIFITHFHADHTSDLFPLIMNIRLRDFFFKNGLKKFPHIVGPTGIKKFIISLSLNFQLPLFNSWNKLKITDVKSSQKFDGFTVEAFKVKHIAFNLAANAYAFRFIINGDKVISFSGDTTTCVGIEKACRDADLFVCDTSYPKNNGNSAHIDTTQIGKIASKSNVKEILLTHFYPQYEGTDFAKEVKENYSGKVTKGKDKMKMKI